MNSLETGYVQFLYAASHPEERSSAPPFQYFIDIANYCNYRCTFCIRPDMTRKVGLMSMKTFRRIVDSIGECYGSVPCIDLARQGEALISPHVFDMIRYAKDAGCHSVRVQTNASLLTEEKARRLIDSGVDKINFSFGSHDPDLYHHYQPGGEFGKTLRQILRFLELRRELGRMDIEAVVSTVEFERLDETKEEFVRIFSEMPFDKVKINQFDSWLGTFEGPSLNGDVDGREVTMCKLLWRILSFAWDGNAVVCNNDYDNNYELGSINDLSVEEMWNGERMQAFRAAMLARDFSQVERPGCELCSRCNAMFDDPRRNSPTYPVDFVTGLREFAETGIMGGSRADEPKAGADELERKYAFLAEHGEEWVGALVANAS